MPARRFVSINSVNPRPQDFLWRDRIPLGAITVLDGDPGDGKSTLLVDLAARVTTGRPMPCCDEARPPGGAVILQSEDCAASVLHPRLVAAGANLDRVCVFAEDGAGASPFALPDDLPLLAAAIAQVGARLVVLDPLASFLGGRSLQGGRIRSVLAPLAQLARRADVAVVVVRHLSKSPTGKAIHRGMGGIDVVGLARAGLLVTRDLQSGSEHERMLLQTKSNVADALGIRFRTVRTGGGAIAVEWLGATELTADDLLERPTQRVDRSALAEAKYVLYSLLAEGPLPANKVIRFAKKAFVSERTLRRAKEELGVESYKRGSGRGSTWLWRLPDDPDRLRPQRNRELDELLDRLIHGDDDDPASDLTDESPDRGSWFDDEENLSS